MKMKAYLRLLLLLLTLTLAAALFGCGCSPSSKEPAATTTATTTAATEPPTVYITIFGEGANAYKIIQPKHSAFSGIGDFVLGICSASSSFGTTAAISSDDSEETAYEILVGDTSRSATQTVAARLAETADEASFYWVVAELDGKIVLYASATEGYTLLLDHFLTTYTDGNSLRVPENCYDVQSMTYAAYGEARRTELIDELKKQISAFNLADFGGINDLELLENAPYAEPPVYPTEGAHPRILITPETVDEIRANLTHPENQRAYDRYLSYSERKTDGKLPTPEAGKNNVDLDLLAVIETKAFRYALTGDEVYGLEAILAMKNYLRTLVCPLESADDAYRYHSYTIYITACVYDWCYDLLTEADKNHLTAAVLSSLAPNLEIGFPPDDLGSVTGHGTEDSLYRDWLAYAIATSDDFPAIYEFVGGRLFEEYTEAGEFYLPSGSHWQGSSYGSSRYYFMLFGELLIRNMTNGEYSLFGDLLEGPAITFAQIVRPDGQSFRIGDDGKQTGSSYHGLAGSATPIFLAASIYGNATLKDLVMSLGDGNAYPTFTYYHLALSHIMYLAINDVALDRADAEPLSLVHYNGSPLGQIIARSAWNDENAVAVYMKIGEAYSANHEHKDAGTFQIFYKGILASDSGFYATYGDEHDYAYNKQTIAHNSLLVYNPNKSNSEKWIYSGGQSIHKSNINGENFNLAAWLEKSTSHQATILGRDAVTEAAGDTETYLYSYLAGDLTNAYDADTVDEVSRYMISIMTGDPESPMLFVVYDRITAVDASFKKTFLLHMEEEPVIGEDGGSAAVTNTRYNPQTEHDNGGKLHVQSLLTDVTYRKIGGEGKEFWVNGTNYPLNMTPGPVAEYGWGRIEISPTEQKLTDRLLTVMYVTDAENTASTVAASEIDADAVVGTELFGKTVIFPKDEKRLHTAFTFRTDATDGTTDYYLMGLADGSWEVSVNDCAQVTYTVTDGGVLHFSDAVGEVTVTPCFTNLTFALDGGKADSALPKTHTYGEVTVLPTASRLGCTFLGWYDNPAFTGEPIEEIPADRRGEITLYAKWRLDFYTVILELGGGTLGNGNYDPRLYVGVAHTLPTAVTLPGATFIGWYGSASFEGDPITVIPAEREEGDFTVYARYAYLRHRITFDTDDFDYNEGTVTSTHGNAHVTHVLDAEGGYLRSVYGEVSAEGGYYGIEALGASGKVMTISFDVRIAGGGSVPWRLRLRNGDGASKLETWILSIDGNGAIYLAEKAGSNKLGDASPTAWTNVSLRIEALGDGKITVDGYINGTLAGNATYTSSSNFILSISDIKRTQFYTGSASGLSDAQKAYETHFDNITVTCE